MTQIILSILKFDSAENIVYANEMLNIIKKAGSTPKIHSMTIKEIERILESVASNGPWPGTPIAQAFVQNNYKNSYASHVLNHLKQFIEKEGIVLDYMMDQQIQDTKRKYLSSEKAKLLKISRQSKKNEENELARNTALSGGVREIHDIFMCDKIASQRKNASSMEKISSYFVSLNIDLISFVDSNYSKTLGHLAIHPSKVIIDLWLHGADGSVFQKDMLIEVMTRCYSLNNTDAQRKMAIVSEYYNSDKFENYDENDAKGFLKLIVSRSKEAINIVDELEQNGSDDVVASNSIQQMLDLVKKTNKEQENENKKMREEISRLQKKVDSIHRESLLEQERQRNLNDVEKERLEKENKAALRKEREEKDRIANENEEKLRKERDEKNKIKKQLLDKMMQDCKKSISMVSYWFWIIAEILGILILLVSIICFIYFLQTEQLELYITKVGTIALITFAIEFIGFLARNKNMYILKPKIIYRNIKEEQISYWKKNNPDYDKIKAELLHDGEDVNSYL